MATVGVKGLKLIVKLNVISIIHSYCKVHTCNVLMKWCLQCQLCFSCFIKLMLFLTFVCSPRYRWQQLICTCVVDSTVCTDPMQS